MHPTKNADVQQRLNPPCPARALQLVLPADGLRLLLAAHDCALDLAAGPWELAVEGRSLEAAGLTTTHLRWLLLHGFVHQGAECSTLTDRRRRFQSVANL